MYGINDNVNYENSFDSYLTGDGYVYVNNMSGFSAMISLDYVDDLGNENNLTTDTIHLFNSNQLTIPAKATNISIIVSMLDAIGQWVPIYNNVLLQAGVINLQLSGTMWNPQVEVIGESEASNNGVTFLNRGAFVAQFSIYYYVNGQEYNVQIPSFSVGMTRKITVPSLATNLDVTVQIDTTGFGSWSTVYHKCFQSLTNLEATLSGVAFSASIEVNNDTFDGVLGECKSNVAVPINIPETNNNTIPMVGGVGNGNVTSCTLANDILNKYMEFIQQAHTQFVQVLDKSMRK